MKKPYIISHMMESVDGRIDCAMTEQIDSSGAYYKALDLLDCPSQLMGRVTMQKYYAENVVYKLNDLSPIGHPMRHKAAESDGGYMIALDTRGTLCWKSNQCDGKPLLIITSEACPKAILGALARQNISWIAVGKDSIDLERAMDALYTDFGVRRLAITGGGHANGSFLNSGFIDEVSIMIAPGIDGRSGETAAFDGISHPHNCPTKLRLVKMEQLHGGIVWLRYKVLKKKK